MTSRIPVLAGVLALLFSGCNKESEQIRVYRLAKAPLEAPAAAGNMTLPPDTASPDAQSPATQMSTAMPAVPTDWQSQPPSQMRQASFLVRGEGGAVADISLVVLGPAAGNVLENVNRWRSQLGQPALSDEQLNKAVQHLMTPRGDVSVVDIEGKPENGDAGKDGRIIAAMILQDGKTSFFKMRGNPAIVEGQKDNFIKWVGAVCSAGASATDMSPVNADLPPAAAGAPQIHWEVPEGWVATPPSAMRYASFSAPGKSGPAADISVVTFPGDGGSDTDNVNRWRRQLGLAPLEAGGSGAAVLPLQVGDNTFSTIDMTGPKSRVFTAWVRRDGRTWFFKITGSSETVEAEKPLFVKFLQSVKF